MSIVTWEQVSEQIERLAPADKLRVFKKLEADVRPRVIEREQDKRDGFRDEMERMAADPEIQRELRAIQADFAGTEADGLHITGGV